MTKLIRISAALPVWCVCVGLDQIPVIETDYWGFHHIGPGYLGCRLRLDSIARAVMGT